MIEELNEKLLQEIVDNSNHENIESVKENIYTGEIEIYENKDEYEKADYSLEHEDYYIVLSNGNVVHFIGG